MKKSIFIFCFISAILSAGAQELSSYKYIIVPAEFDFLKEPNQYELNALTKFLLEKKGYEVYMEGDEEVKNVSGNRCEALFADLKNDSGLFVTRLKIVLKDCGNTEVLVSEEGKSRVKDYKPAFQEALRKAVGSIPEKDNAVEEAIVSGFPQVDNAPEEQNDDNLQEENEVEGEVIEETVDNKTPEARQLPGATPAPDVERLDFVKGNGEYFLVKTENGYNFYQQGMGEPFAALIKSSSGSGYIYSSITAKGMAQFNQNGNLVVEILNPESNELESTEYKLQDQ